MIVPSIVLIVSFCVAIKFFKFFDKENKFFRYFFPIMLSCLFFLISVWLFSYVLHKDYFIVEYSRTPIAALIDANETEGSLFIFTGHVSQREYYKFYIDRADGGKEFRKVPAQDTIIYEEDRTDGYISDAKLKAEYADWVHLWLIPRWLTGEEPRIFAIHVPKGTIQAGFSIDMK